MQLKCKFIEWVYDTAFINLLFLLLLLFYYHYFYYHFIMVIIIIVIIKVLNKKNVFHYIHQETNKYKLNANK